MATDTRPCKSDIWAPACGVHYPGCTWCEHKAPGRHLVSSLDYRKHPRCLGRDGYLFVKAAGIKLRGMR